MVDTEEREVSYFQALKEIMQAGRNGDWDGVLTAVDTDFETGVYLLTVMSHQMPPEVLREVALKLYSDKGDYYPSVRKFVRSSLKARPADWRKDLPESVRNLDMFTVYRAGAEDIGKAACSLSWTLSRDVAEWFVKRHEFHSKQPQHLYKGIISADKVIAYIGGRSEFEIVQYRNVKQIEEIPMQGPSAEFLKIREATNETSIPAWKEAHKKNLELFNRWIEKQNYTN